jgi:hypothetical protein
MKGATRPASRSIGQSALEAHHLLREAQNARCADGKRRRYWQLRAEGLSSSEAQARLAGGKATAESVRAASRERHRRAMTRWGGSKRMRDSPGSAAKWLAPSSASEPVRGIRVTPPIRPGRSKRRGGGSGEIVSASASAILAAFAAVVMERAYRRFRLGGGKTTGSCGILGATPSGGCSAGAVSFFTPLVIR